MKRYCLTILLLTSYFLLLPAQRIAVADWMVLKRQKLGEFALARQLGADGVEMDMGGLGHRPAFDNKLRQPEARALFRHTADSLGCAVSNMAMSGFYGQDFATHPQWRSLTAETIDACHAMGTTTIFLPVRPTAAGRDSLVARLAAAGAMAQAEGVVIGIDTPLSADSTLALLRDIGSPAVRVFYKVQTAVERHRDICRELRTLGAKHLAPAMHISGPDGRLLRDEPRVPLARIKRTLHRIGWQGWLIVERSRDTTRVRDVRYNYGENVKHLKQIFK